MAAYGFGRILGMAGSGTPPGEGPGLLAPRGRFRNVPGMRTRPARLLCVAACALLAACDAFDSSLLSPSDGTDDRDGGRKDGGGNGMDGSVTDGGGTGDGGDACVTEVEACNLVDDDCDGHTDEDTAAACEAIVVNAVTECVVSRGAARCLLMTCHDGFANCDGDPRNGCEADACKCRPCPDDGGTDDAGP